MRALITTPAGITLRDVPLPAVERSDDVLIRVAVAGICRTDVQVACGDIATTPGRVLGHEFAGWIAAVGTHISGLTIGQRVAAMPWIVCGDCAGCAESPTLAWCQRPQQLGVHRDGAFADYIVVPAAVVRTVPDAVPLQRAAYVEPLAAALAVLNADLRADQAGCIYGTNRFSRLIELILRRRGFTRLEVHDVHGPMTLTPNRYDFIIETQLDADALDDMLTALRPGGQIVIRSRAARPVPLDLRRAITKEASLRAVNYGSVEQALALAADDSMPWSTLLAEPLPLEGFADVMRQARHDEERKLFFALAPRAETLTGFAGAAPHAEIG
jgi:L-iditol 2-dehydrogenase